VANRSVPSRCRGWAVCDVLCHLNFGMQGILATWVVEAAVHHLDLAVELPVPPPTAASLAVVRETLDVLLGGEAPAGWDDATFALKGTGRLALTGDEREALGHRSGKFPLFG
jgi:hypothetical protein